MTDKEIENRLTKVEERCKSNTNQIVELKDIVNEIRTLSNTQVKMIEQIKATNENVEKLSDKIEKIEQEPRQNLNKIKLAIITSIIGVLVGAVIGALLNLF